MKIRFSLNEMGLNVEYFAHGAWRSAGLFSHEAIAKHGGLENFKTKALYSLYPACGMRQEIAPPGTYTENGATVQCV